MRKFFLFFLVLMVDYCLWSNPKEANQPKTISQDSGKLIYSVNFLDEKSLADFQTVPHKIKNTNDAPPVISTPSRITPKVDVISGAYIEQEEDLVVAGTEPLSIRRFYSHQPPYEARSGLWILNPECYAVANLEWTGQENFVSVGEKTGRVEVFGKASPNQYAFCLERQKNFSNINAALPSGQTHPLNTKITFQKTRNAVLKRNYFYEGDILDGSGRKRSFRTIEHSWTIQTMVHPKGENIVYVFTPDCWTPYVLPIHEERLPNGNINIYEYKPLTEKGLFSLVPILSSITTYNHSKTKVLGFLKFQYQQDAVGCVKSIEIKGSDDRRINFTNGGAQPYALTGVKSPNNPPVSYSYQDFFLYRVEKPEGRHFVTEYYPDTKKVKTQVAPVGANGEMCPIASYVYKEGSTDVVDAIGNKTVYRYDTNHRITAIESYEKNTLYRTDRNSWDPGTGNLLVKTIEDGSGKIYFKQEYRYDKNQNVIEEKVGDGKESYTLFRTYSDDGFNLKLSETDRFGKTTRYTYVPQTNLLASEKVCDMQRPRQRTFYFYDNCATLTKMIIDDGGGENADDLSNVTFRKIIQITPKQTLPCFGLPEIVEEKTIDLAKREILLEKRIYTYTPFGKILKEEHYDSTNTFRYSIINEYDEKERLVATTNALGGKISYTYDCNNNLTSISGPSPEMRKELSYDCANRLVKEKTRQIDGSFLSVEKRYDPLGRVISEIDASGNETRFSYDLFDHITTIIHPDGSIEKREYDVLGNMTKEIDAKGYVTRKTYNFRNQPTFISYPDGSQEHFEYHRNGTLSNHTDRNGAVTQYQYDVFNHPVTVITCGSCPCFKLLSATYSFFSLLSTTDGEGIKTFFTYDFAGRKIAEEKAGKKTFFSYDALGRLVRTQKNDAVYVEEYDFLNRLIEKRTEDCSRKILRQERYGYDAAGNRTKVISSTGTTELSYNTLGQIIQKKDPLGHVSTISYDYVGGLKMTEINPAGIQTIHLFDSQQREKETLKKNAQGEIIQQVSRRFDPNGNCIEEFHPIFEGTTPTKTLLYQKTFGPMNRLESILERDAGRNPSLSREGQGQDKKNVEKSLTVEESPPYQRGVLQPEQKETHHLYDERGRLKTLIKPDSTPINYAYDDLGRLTHFWSTDFDYHYSYDRNDRMISVADAISQTITQRSYDAFDNVIQEVLANGLKIVNGYDLQGRRTSCTLADGSSIGYSYSADRLAGVSRAGLTYSYTQRDLDGNLTEVKLPSTLGQIHIERDALGRYQKFTSPYYSAEFPQDAFDADGNLCHYRFQDSISSVDSFYSYDELDQLILENDHTYIFDSLYNRLKKDNFPCTVNDLCQIIDDGEKNYRYDKNGNLLSDGIFTFTYDSQNRLIEATKGNLRVCYTYDPFNRRLSKIVRENGLEIKKENYLWDGQNEIGVSDNSGTLQELRILGEGFGAEIGAAVLIELKGKRYLPIHDHRGSIVILMDVESKTPSETYRYNAFGERILGGSLSPWQFSSKRFDPETGFIYFGRRYYSPDLGRWISTDPQGFADGPNLYAYLHNSPLMTCDPYGLWSNPYTGTRSLFDFLGRTIEFVGQHLIPISGLRDFVENTGRLIRGGNFWEKCSYHQYRNEIIPIEGKAYPDVKNTHANGILNTRDEAVLSAQKKSEAYGGGAVDLFYRPTHGFICDMIDAVIAKIGIQTNYTRMVAAYYNVNFDKNHKTTFESSAHSLGGTNMMNVASLLSVDCPERIHLTTFGSATLIPDGVFGNIVNYVSRNDFVSATSFVPYCRAMFSKDSNVQFLKSNSLSPYYEHGLVNKTYLKKINDLGERFVENLND